MNLSPIGRPFPRTPWVVAAATVAALGLAAPLLAQEPAKAQAPASAAPKLVLVEETKNVGTVAKGEVIEQDFLVRNDGKADLHITDVKPACGCTVSKYDKVIKPGETGKVHLTLDTKAFQGPISKSALIVTDDPSTPQVTVFLSAYVKPYVEMLPYGFFRLQGLVGEEVSSEITLASDEPDFKVTKVEAPHEYLSASFAEVAEKDRIAGKGARQYKVTLTASKSTPMGIPQGVVRVLTTLPKQPELQIAISGSIVDAVGVIPSQVTFGTFDPKEGTMTKEIDVINRNAKNPEFKVTGVESTVPAVKAEVKPIDKTRVKVVLSVDPGLAKKGPFDGALTIKTNDGTKSELKVGLKGVVL